MGWLLLLVEERLTVFRARDSAPLPRRTTASRSSHTSKALKAGARAIKVERKRKALAAKFEPDMCIQAAKANCLDTQTNKRLIATGLRFESTVLSGRWKILQRPTLHSCLPALLRGLLDHA